MSCISINQKQEQIIIKIYENAIENDYIEELQSKIEELKRMYCKEKTPILVTGKVLKNEEIERVKELILNKINVEIEIDSPQELGLHGIKKTFEREVNLSETQYIKGSLRSGKKLEFEGSIVVLGDVNGGSEIVASENIVVLGKLRGLAHAGAKGNKKAIIAAQLIESPQIRIANKIREIEKEEQKYQYAYLEEEIILE